VRVFEIFGSYNMQTLNNQETKINRKEFEDKIIDFAVLTAKIINETPYNKFSKHSANQLVRSCTSPALNYG